ncbi:MAG: SLC13 family permease [Caldisericia bacterium]|jgi:sodium-dependent dicarboxylate transporter 2/3/5|nr:SLC13 family permease [Caldisericia bacterium]
MSKVNEKKSGLSNIYLIHCVIGLTLMFGFGFLPAFGPVTELGMKVLGIFLGSIYMWSFVDILWPSLLGLAALAMSGYDSMINIMYNSFGDSVTVLVLLGMIFFGAVQDAGVTEHISKWFLTRKVINGRPIVFSFIFITCTYVLAALSASILPPILLMWAILYDVLKSVGYTKGEKYTSLMVIGTYFGAMVGHCAKPFVATGLILTGAFTKVTGQEINYVSYILFGFIMAILSIIIYCLLMKYMFKPDMTKIANISTEQFEKEHIGPMTVSQKILFFSMFGFLILMLLPGLLSPGIAKAFLGKIGNNGIALLFIGSLCMIKINNKPLMNFNKVITNYVSWGVYFLVSMVMVLGTALTAKTTGLTELFTQVLNPILGGQSVFIFFAILLAVALVTTNVGNNTVVGVVMIPIIYGFSEMNGANLVAVTVAVIFMLHYAIVTPAASIYAAALHGNTEWVDTKDIVYYTSIVLVFMYVLYIVVGIPLANVLF